MLYVLRFLLFVACGLMLFALRDLRCVDCCVLFIVRCSLLVVCCLLFVILVVDCDLCLLVVDC